MFWVVVWVVLVYSRVVICSFWWKGLFMVGWSLWGWWLLSLFKFLIEIVVFFWGKRKIKLSSYFFVWEVCKLSFYVIKYWEWNWSWFFWEKWEVRGFMSLVFLGGGKGWYYRRKKRGVIFLWYVLSMCIFFFLNDIEFILLFGNVNFGKGN